MACWGSMGRRRAVERGSTPGQMREPTRPAGGHSKEWGWASGTWWVTAHTSLASLALQRTHHTTQRKLTQHTLTHHTPSTCVSFFLVASCCLFSSASEACLAWARGEPQPSPWRASAKPMESLTQACGEPHPGMWRASARHVESLSQARGEPQPGMWRASARHVESLSQACGAMSVWK